MLAFPNAKINLGLRVLSNRSDGYHNIVSCLYPIPWRDVLEIVPAAEFDFKQTGLEIPGDSSGNLCVKAYNLLKETYNLPPVLMHLHKVIPMGAGLGGGSSDGATTLKVLNALFKLDLSLNILKNLAGQLGSDCPFFIENIPALVTGTGTEVSPFPISLSEAYLAIRHPGIHISTADAYAGINPDPAIKDLESILHSPIESWQEALINDFESSIFKKHPEIAEIKDQLYDAGADYAAMSGSGSAVFGLFKEKPTLNDFQVFELR